MNIGPIIMTKRKEKKVTQQELANFIGVSKASVSKWETGQTYPDITLLPLLAAYFDITIDSLLTYDPQLDNHEIQRIYAMLKDGLNTQSSEEVLATFRSFVRRYYSCYPFILQMGMFLLNHYDLLPGENRMERYAKEAQELFIHVRTQSKDPEMILRAQSYEAYTSLGLRDFDQVLTILGDSVPVLFPAEILIAAAQKEKGDEQQALVTLQSSIYQYTTVFMSFLGNYLHVLIQEPKNFTETVFRGKCFAELFHFETLHPISLMNFQLAAVFGYALMGDEGAALGMLDEFLMVLKKTKFPVELHSDDYFNQIDVWLKDLEIGNQLPRNTFKLKESFIEIVINNPLLENFSDQEHLHKIYDELQSLNEMEEQDNEQL